MIKGLTDFEKYKVIRPVIGDCEYDKYGFPVIRRLTRDLDYENLEVRNFKCMKSLPDNDNKLLMMFSYDKDLMRFWNDPLKRIPIMQTYAAVATPDFSIYPTMNINEIRHNRMRMALTMLMFAQGVPLIMAGDEFGNTQQGNNNAYCQDNELSWIDWSCAEKNKNLVEFTKKLIQLRIPMKIVKKIY